MWAVGCLFAEMALAQTLFTGESEMEQLKQIFSLTGVPDSETLNLYYKDQTGPRIEFPNWPRVPFDYLFAPRESDEAAFVVEAFYNR